MWCDAPILNYVRKTTHISWINAIIGQQSPVSSDAATTARASSIAGGVDMGRGHTRGESDHNNLMGHDPPLMPVTNPMYQRWDSIIIYHFNIYTWNIKCVWCVYLVIVCHIMVWPLLVSFLVTVSSELSESITSRSRSICIE